MNKASARRVAADVRRIETPKRGGMRPTNTQLGCGFPPGFGLPQSKTLSRGSDHQAGLGRSLAGSLQFQNLAFGFSDLEARTSSRRLSRFTKPSGRT